MSDSPCARALTPQMIEAFEQFNRGEYWHQHETLEAIWRAETDERIRHFYKGILQIGVGLYHLSRRNYAGAGKVLVRGMAYLRPYAPRCMGVDVTRLIDEASRILARAQAREEINPDEFPRVHYQSEI